MSQNYDFAADIADKESQIRRLTNQLNIETIAKNKVKAQFLETIFNMERRRCSRCESKRMQRFDDV